MNIYAKHGAKVVFAYPDNGYDHDIETAKKHLVVGKTYTIDHTDVYDWHTDVWLIEVPGVRFNSVHFQDEEESHAAKPSSQCR